MFKKIQMNVVAVTFRLLRLLLAVTIWSCHAWVAPTYRLCHVLAAAVSGLRGFDIDRPRVAAVIPQVKALLNWSLRGVKRRSNLKKNEIATPSGLAMTCQQSNCISTTYSELSDSRPGLALIKSIPRIWSHGVKQSMGQGETPNSLPVRQAGELLPARSALAKAGRTPNFKGFTLIELIVVMIIIGILAATVLPRIDFGGTSSTASATGAAYMIASDIRYAQECAMASRVAKSILFDTSHPSYYTFNPTNTGMDPSGQLQGAAIGTTITFTFNSLGEPTAGGGSSVTVSAGGITRTITVTQYTGKVSIS